MPLHLTGGNIADRTAFEAVMANLRLPRVTGGRPRTHPDSLLGDKGYSSKKIRAYLRRRGIKAVIPERKDQLANRKRRGRGRGSRGGRPHAFDRQTRKQRNPVERCSGKLKQWQAIATRFDKLAGRYLTGATIGCLMPACGMSSRRGKRASSSKNFSIKAKLRRSGLIRQQGELLLIQRPALDQVFQFPLTPHARTLFS